MENLLQQRPKRGNPLGQFDAIAVPFSSTTHLWSPWVIAESPAALADIISTARTLSRRQAVAASSLALFHPPRDAVDLFPIELE